MLLFLSILSVGVDWFDQESVDEINKTGGTKKFRWVIGHGTGKVGGKEKTGWWIGGFHNLDGKDWKDGKVYAALDMKGLHALNNVWWSEKTCKSDSRNGGEGPGSAWEQLNGVFGGTRKDKCQELMLKTLKDGIQNDKWSWIYFKNWI